MNYSINKYFYLLLVLALVLYSCKSTGDNENISAELEKPISTVEYPDELEKVFATHGGVSLWRSFSGLAFDMEKEEDQVESYQVNLHDRRERIVSPNFTMGYDGKDYWMEADTSVKMNPVFYKNLIFYFYAMPFVLGDNGIHYDKVDPIVFDDMSYPGYRISYDDGVGVSSKDEYFIHYDPETYQMAWLGYTVTFRNQKPSDKLGWINYNDWIEIDGLVLPKSLSWYTTENNLPSSFRNKRSFKNVKLFKESFEAATFAPTAKATITKQ